MTATRPLPAAPRWLRAGGVSARPARVDRERNVIRGYTVAQLGPFKDLRGEFNAEGLRQIAAMMNAPPAGVKSRFTHPTLSGDGLGKFLGRSRDARVEGDAVRADLHLSPTSRKTPSGDLGGYVMDLAESDPGAFGSSLVLVPRLEYRREGDGTLARGPDGEELPPLWFPEEIHASDVVDDGDAVHDGFLSADGDLPDALVRLGSQLLDSAFAGQPRAAVEARVSGWLARYLTHRFGAGLAGAGAAPPDPGRETQPNVVCPDCGGPVECSAGCGYRSPAATHAPLLDARRARLRELEGAARR